MLAPDGRRLGLVAFVVEEAPSEAIQMVLLAIDGTTGGLDPNSPIDSLSDIFSFLTLWPGIAVSVKRLHDRGRSAWFLLILLIPVIGAFWLLIELGILPGTSGPNRFGPPQFRAPAAF